MKKVLSFLSAIVIGSGLLTVPAYATSNSSAPASNAEFMPDVSGMKELSKEEALKIVTSANEKSYEYDSVEMSGDLKMEYDGSKMTFPLVASIDNKNANMKMEISAMGEKMEFYVVDKKAYVIDSKGEKAVWLHMPITPELLKVKTQQDPRLMDMVKVYDKGDGYVITSPEDMTIDELAKKYPEFEFMKEYIYLNVKEAAIQNNGADEETIDKAKDAFINGVKMNFAVEMDKEFKVTGYKYQYDVDLSEFDKSIKPMIMTGEFQFSKHNEVEAIKLPDVAEDAEFMFSPEVIEDGPDFIPTKDSSTKEKTKAN